MSKPSPFNVLLAVLGLSSAVMAFALVTLDENKTIEQDIAKANSARVDLVGQLTLANYDIRGVIEKEFERRFEDTLTALRNKYNQSQLLLWQTSDWLMECQRGGK